MAEWPDPRIAPNNAGVTVDGRAIGSAAIDQGLRSHMLKVYNYMASAVLLTGIIALVFAQSGLALQVLSTPLRYVLMFAPLAFIFLGARHQFTDMLSDNHVSNAEFAQLRIHIINEYLG